jgi:hypothetical protein
MFKLGLRMCKLGPLKCLLYAKCIHSTQSQAVDLSRDEGSIIWMGQSTPLFLRLSGFMFFEVTTTLLAIPFSWYLARVSGRNNVVGGVTCCGLHSLVVGVVTCCDLHSLVVGVVTCCDLHSLGDRDEGKDLLFSSGKWRIALPPNLVPRFRIRELYFYHRSLPPLNATGWQHFSCKRILKLTMSRPGSRR